MNAHIFFMLFCGIIFNMDYTFLFIGQIPFRVTQNPRYPISACPKNYFSVLHLSPLSLRFSGVSSNFSKLLDQSPLVIINRSSMYARINSNPLNISFIFSWKMSRELLTPIVRHLYWYFHHGRIFVHKLLSCSLRRM